MDLNPGEKVILEKLANVRRKYEYAGGRVVVTNQRVLLLPHALNLDSRPAEVLLSDIAAVEPFSQFGFVPTGVRLARKDGAQQHFICWGRTAVMAAIRGAMPG